MEKKKRKPRSEEAKRKTSLAMMNRKKSEEHKKQISKSMTKSIETRISEMAEDERIKNMLIEIFNIRDFLSTCVNSKDSQKLIDLHNSCDFGYKYFIQKYSESYNSLSFSYSATHIKKTYGLNGFKLFESFFIRIQPGGYSKQEGAGYDTLWSTCLDSDVLFSKLMIDYAKEHNTSPKNLTIEDKVKIIMNLPTYKRQRTKLFITSSNNEKLKVISYGAKAITLQSDRDLIKIKRNDMKNLIDGLDPEVYKSWLRMLKVAEPNKEFILDEERQIKGIHIRC